VHDAHHPLDLVGKGLVELGDREARRAQHGVADLADLVERGEAPALEGGIVEGA
jgi:hypothetical protein